MKAKTRHLEIRKRRPNECVAWDFAQPSLLSFVRVATKIIGQLVP
jgi:hypothetical protein